MLLDKFKTQILILHSEQATLDNLSSGFSDSYTVHCATSGSEALNTLVETPINVIITAQDLPGMSGIEALREAKKRSPDTIGILLASDATSNIEALIGDEEVFQVVSGDVTSDGLLRLVDNATRQMRLMALADSANDTEAGVDLSAEHIVMETSENGSTIISDGTGRMPALDPKKVSAAACVGARAVDILVLTKDQEFLKTIKNSSRGMHKVYYANTLAQANDVISKHKIGVAVVDAAMIGKKIEQLTQYLRKGSPRLVSIVAGRRNDGEMLMDLINRGKVYRFLLKPVSPGRARLAVESSVKHHLEAPDAAFKSNAIPAAVKPVAAKPAPKPVAKRIPKRVVKRIPKPAAMPAVKTARQRAAKPAVQPRPLRPVKPATSADPPLGTVVVRASGRSPLEDGLADAFGQDKSSLIETVANVIGTVSKGIASVRKSARAPATPAPSIAVVPPNILRPGPASAADSGGSWLRTPKILGIGAAVVVIVAGALFWMMSGSDESALQPDEDLGTPFFAEADVIFDALPIAIAAGDVDALIDEARLARDAGQIFNPVGSNAIELFAAALAADTDNSVVAIELDAAIEQALRMAESAMLESRLDDADAALQRVASVEAENARLPFLTAQLSQMQLRGRLDEARAAIRDDRYEDAANALSAARKLGVADTAEIDAIVVELRTARGEQRVDDVLARAAARLDSGALIRPANNNARYYFELVLSSDAENSAARQGLSVIAGKLVFQARTEIDNGDLSSAEDILAVARDIDPTNSEVASTLTTLADKRAALAEQQRITTTRRSAAATETERQVENEHQAEAAEPIADTEAEGLASQTIQKPSPADTDIIDQPVEPATESADTGAVGESGMAADEGSVVAGEPSSDSAAPGEASAEKTVYEQPVGVSYLNRVRYVAPKYPRSAQRRRLSGWVDVLFTVIADGTVTDVEVRASEPGDTFVKAAVKAVEKWEFEPVIENGVVVRKKAGVRMMFALE
ncbi:MAG: TonB family protein [Proteobacteria bacterium]|nr:TonB family protein [Pseudomonadota bacterium]